MNGLPRHIFDILPAYFRGYISYSQACWNPDADQSNPFKAGSAEYKAFARGVLDCINDFDKKLEEEERKENDPNIYGSKNSKSQRGSIEKKLWL